MKYISTLIILLTLICHSQFYSQSNFKKYREYKKYTLKAEDIKAVQKDGKTNWTVKTTLTNHSRDTLFYFVTTNCETANYSIDTMTLFVDSPKCETGKQTVIAIKPKGRQIVDLQISAIKPLTSSMSFRIVMFIFKAKNMNDNTPFDWSMTTKPTLAVSNKIKT